MENFKEELTKILQDHKKVELFLKITDFENREYKDLIHKFVIFNLKKELSEVTVEIYVKNINLFLSWYRGNDLREFTKIDAQEYRDYLKEGYKCKGNPLGTSSINNKIGAINRFFIYLDQELEYKIGRRIKKYRIEKQHSVGGLISNNHIREIIKQARIKNDYRAIAIFYTLFYTGARVSEMIQLKVSDIEKISVMIKGKGKKIRELFIPEKLRDELKEYVKYRKVPGDGGDCLFTSRNGVISRQIVDETIKYYCGQVKGIKKEIAHADAFRDRYALNLINIGVNEAIVCKLLGRRPPITGMYVKQDRNKLLRIINKLNLEEDEQLSS